MYDRLRLLKVASIKRYDPANILSNPAIVRKYEKTSIDRYKDREARSL